MKVAPPKFLYKYMAADTDEHLRRAREAIVQSQVYFAVPAKLNDPFEGKVIPDFSASREEQELHWRAKRGSLPPMSDAEFEEGLAGLLANHGSEAQIKAFEHEILSMHEKSGVYCMFPRHDSLAMWAYYGGGHQGVCLRYVMSEAFVQWSFAEGRMLLPVRYDHAYPRIRFFGRENESRMLSMLSTKSREWKHEREWRIVWRDSSGLAEMPRQHLDCVLVGVAASEITKAAVVEMAKERQPRLAVFGGQVKRRQFDLEFQRLL